MQVDRDLVEPARNGDREAYADLIRARGDRLFAIAQRILRDVDRTEDAVQDALVIAWRDLPGLRDPDRFDAWLHRLLVRSCVSEATRERRLVANLRVLPTDLPTGTDEYRPSPTGTSWSAASDVCLPSSAPSSCCATSPDTSRPRSPSRSASRLARSAPDSTMPTARCVPLSRPTPARSRSEDVPHDTRP